MTESSSIQQTTIEPSKYVKYFKQTLVLDESQIELRLVTMRRSFLLVISGLDDGDNLDDEASEVSRDAMIKGFMESNNRMKGMSLAIGQSSTCILNSNNSLNSTSLAERLSKCLNQNRPVYVANNFGMIKSGEFIDKLYMKIFQFVKNHYIIRQ